MENKNKSEDIRSNIRQRYSSIARSQEQESQSSCCCSTEEIDCCSPDETTGDCCDSLYDDTSLAHLPTEVKELSLGCGDPVTLSALQSGQTVLDLGSGGGIDCFLAAKAVGPTGYVIGVDMTPEMLEKARNNKLKTGIENVEFRLGEIEHLPVPDNSVDVIISNCVINLSLDKPQVLKEAFRVLHPGGKLAVSDIVTDGPLPESIKSNLLAWAGCIAGALEIEEYKTIIREAGFINIEVSRAKFDDDSIFPDDEAVNRELNLSVASSDKTYKERIFSANITAYKPEE